MLHCLHLLIVGLKAIQLAAKVDFPPILLAKFGKVVGLPHYFLGSIAFFWTPL
jgi:hypothetical protein